MVSVLIKESDLGFRYWLVLLGKALHARSARLYPRVKSMGATCTGICELSRQSDNHILLRTFKPAID